MSDSNHDEMMDVLRTMLKVQALSAVRDFQTKKEKVLFLAEAGLAPKEIAPIVGSSAQSVSQAIYDAKKKASKED